MATYRYQYYYAIIDLETGECVEVQDTTDYIDPNEYPEYIRISELNWGYLGNYYNRENGNWYTDPDFTIPLVL